MPRVKGGPRAHLRHKKVLKLAKGYRGTRSKLYKRANEAVVRAGEHAFAGRKLRKRDMRRLWITRISAASKMLNTSYSKLMGGLKKSGCTINRKMLSEIAATDMKGFEQIVKSVK